MRDPAMAVGFARIDQYRLALLPAAQSATPAACCSVLLEGGSSFLNLVLAQDLGPLWHQRLHAGSMLSALPTAWADALRTAHMAAAMSYLPQRATLAQVDQLFSAQGIAYLVMKGVFVRECVYAEPAVRPACDVDVLVSPQERARAARVLVDAGYTCHVEPVTISHEATFSNGPVDIDLHWHVMRPGRTRQGLTDGFLVRRQQVNGVWGLSDSDTLFLMLTHPAFFKYVCSPNMGLARVADFLLWVQHRPVDWPAVLQMLETEGLKTAAWAVLSWFQMLAPPELAKSMDAWLATLRPGHLRAAYLRAWLTHNLTTRLLQRPMLIQLGFTLLLHDRPTDMQHVLQEYRKTRQHRLRDARLLLGDE